MTDSSQPWTQWIGSDTVAMLYAEGIKRWGGAGSSPQSGCVEGALGAAYSAELYTPENEAEGFVPGLIFAAYLLFYLTQKHCYDDGNKRIAWACMTFVLLGFGLTVQANEDDAEKFCLSVARGEVKSGASVLDWIAERLAPVM
jgi:prophage maintenance system killer protein